MRKLIIAFILSVIAISKTPIKGIWLTVSGTDAPYSEQGIIDVVRKCEYLGINTIYFAVWNRLMINYTPKDQTIFQKYPFIKTNPAFSFNPLQLLIRESHKSNIKVIAWFEFGFASTYQDDSGGIIFKYKPDWKAINKDGELVTKNNFQWMNAFHPEVQQFMLDIVEQLIQSYPTIDGIQGDDRLPALPSTAGYDNFTISLYKKDHQGTLPPDDYKDKEWIDWRSALLTGFMKIFSSLIRNQERKYEIHMAPSVFPFSKDEYLQDWPTWVSQNTLDYIIPQIYRYDISAYRTTLQQNLKEVPENKKQYFYPGILIGLGENPIVNAKNLQESIKINRALAIEGQSFFYYESLKDTRVCEIIKQFYNSDVLQQ